MTVRCLFVQGKLQKKVEIDQQVNRERNAAALAAKIESIEAFKMSINVYADQCCDVCTKTCYPNQVVKFKVPEAPNCKANLADPKKRLFPPKTYWNRLDPGPVSKEIKVLTRSEVGLLSRVHAFMKIIKFDGRFGQYGFRGLATLFAQDIFEVTEKIDTLPRSSYDSNIIIVSEELEKLDITKEYKIDRTRIFNALAWLLKHNPLYRDVSINKDVHLDENDLVRTGPVEDALPLQLLIASSHMFIMHVVATLFGGYIASSLILFKFPNLIHKKKKLKFLCTHISHRGGAGESLENTIPAFENAIKQGTDMLEVDLHLTKDGKVVVSHDNNLLRVTGVNVNISDSNYQDLPPLKRTLAKDFQKGKPFACDEEEKIPLLKEVFEKFPQVAINIDIKVNNDLLITKVNNLIKEYNREDITVWGNFSNDVTKKCHKLNPNIPIYFSAKRVILLVILTYNGLLPFIPLKESCLELLMPSVIFTNPSMMISRDKFWSPWIVWLIEKLLMRRSLFEHLSKRGIQTYLWVLNEEKDYKRAFELGATGVMTDYPTKLRHFLVEHDLQNRMK
ncbi:lysophospholipase D GDPD1-like [Uloborus diversus]|uniref:lysophospholipase D GDPD1-like n=1 Tax=Uloborus diversus TaxID=327109 RepID=UPI002409001D|nr:lysophospholipase D GDPD1-like [Uloborus diversus]